MVSKKIAVLKVSKKKAIEQFLLITRPMHKLTPQEVKVLTLVLYIYYENYTNFVRDEDRWKYVFDYDTKVEIKNELKMNDAGFQNVLTQLRKKQVLVDNKVVPKFRPSIEVKTNTFELIFRFEFIDK